LTRTGLPPISNGVVRPVQIGAILAVAAAVSATIVAVGSYDALCLDGTHLSCPEESGASWELRSQLGLAITGLIAVGAMLFATWRRAYRWAALLLLLSIALFAGWAVLLDIATHDDFTLIDW
jgi:uncharacterized membrane protein YgdD (TMEM256/DUF423 family)